MVRLQVAASEATSVTVTERTWLPAKHVRTVNDAALTLEPDDRDQIQWLQACTYVVLAFVSFDRPDTGTSLQQENVLMNQDDVTVVLTLEGQEPQAEEATAVHPLVGVGAAAGAPRALDTVQG
ncbi:hypothetical protein CYMTET_19436 [Cymbomonas tetramitiformis]|uniref:Uncharacterized protein n=1 Tax=Cymbomonas tetramitiformis TaxID=36881 RepID=A0AAE0G6K0_9CHLO|nr:hypothetical protein CYMTET_19436 [Cymbomonas tetramitiformis]